jgi:hypothetical protein
MCIIMKPLQTFLFTERNMTRFVFYGNKAIYNIK